MNSLSPEEKNSIVLEKYGKHFCAAPFTSFHEGENGLISTCCKTRNPLGFTSENSLDEIMNSSEAQRIRKEFLEGKKPAQCQACWKLEEAGGVASNRIHSNNMGFDSIDDAVSHTDANGYMSKQYPTWLDVLWTNKCNFACLGCKPSLSSTIAKNYVKEFSILHDVDYSHEASIEWKNSNDSKIDYVLKHSDSIHTIHLNGGEPLMAEDLYEFLEALINKGLHKKIKLWSHTNGSVKSYKGKDLILDYFSQWGRNCKITLSNDGHNQYGEYIRYGYKDAKWLETYQKIKDADIEFNIQSCLNIFNIMYLEEMNDWLLSNTCDRHGNKPHGTLTLWSNNPINIRLTNHVPELKEKALSILKSLEEKETPYWERSLSKHYAWLKEDTTTNQGYLKSFYNGVVAMDAKRNTNFLETFPALESLYLLGKSI